MSIEDLLKLVPPPEAPVDLGSEAEWADVERQVGTELPADYKSYIQHYGTGVLAEWIIIYNPFSNSALGLLPAVAEGCEILALPFLGARKPEMAFLAAVAPVQRRCNTLPAQCLRRFVGSRSAPRNGRAEILRSNQSDEIIDLPYAIFPERPGLLPCGQTNAGGTILWLTTGAPEEWPVVVVPRSQFEDYPRFDMPLTEFLAKLIRKEIAVDAWDNIADGDPARLRSFAPF